MRWCLVLVVILGVLVAGIAKVATRHRGASASSPPDEEPSTADSEGGDDERGEAPPSPPPAHGQRPILPTVEMSAAGRAGIAVLHGHVRLSSGRSNGGRGRRAGEDGDVVDLADLAVVASDGTRALSARADGEGRFTFHLPPGVYTARGQPGGGGLR